MPIEITESEDREYRRYKELGTPDTLAERVKKVETLEADNKALRDERRDLKSKVPADGAVVLTGDDAEKWTKVKDVDVDDLTKKATEGEEAKTKLAGFEWEKVARKMAADDGLKFNADALVVLPGIRGFTFESREVTEGDKKVTRWTAKDAEGKTAEVGKDWITGREEWKPLAPAVFAAADGGNGKTNGGGGFSFTPERTAGGGEKKAGVGIDALVEANQKAAQAPNPLRPAKTT